MFERPRSGERALLVQVDFGDAAPEAARQEILELARSAGAQVAGLVTGARKVPDPKYFVGSGKAEEIRAQVQALGAEVVIFDHPLSPGQERNLEKLLQCRVLDRAGLILDIFAQRARTHEGKLQVELAQLRHLSTRLVRGWTHLERQRGGIGLRGPGETQLETDRRLIGDRIKRLRDRLEKVAGHRQLSRRARTESGAPVIALAGYTNAGKTTLFNALTGAGAYAANQLFATLDPTLRRLGLPPGGHAVLADTVGFIRNLPHELVAAFKATLEETREAALILHVIDAGHPEKQEVIEAVNAVLEEIGAGEVPRVEVFNKIDLMGEAPRLEYSAEGGLNRAFVSAATGAGVDDLVRALGAMLLDRPLHGWLRLLPSQGRERARLYALQAVRSECLDDAGSHWLRIEARRHDLEALGLSAELQPLPAM
jgi:GTP-binding protein HflX